MIIKINGSVVTAGAAVQTADRFTVKYPNLKYHMNELVLKSAGLVPLIAAYMGLSKYLTVGVIMFAGTAWMFGHRTKAIELMIGAAAGFLLILNAWDLVNFLEGLKAK